MRDHRMEAKSSRGRNFDPLMASRIVVEWTRTTLRLAVVETARGSSRLRSVRVEPVGEGATVGKVLTDALKKANIRQASVIGVIPRDQVIVRLVKFPSLRLDELTQMVALYGRAQLPYPKDQIVVGHQVIEQKDGFSMVAVVACRRDVIERLFSPLRAAGLSVEQLTVSSWGLAGWYALASKSVKLQEPVFLVNRDEERTELVVVRGGRVLLSRSVAPGAKGLGADEGLAVLLQEVERSLTTLRKDLPGTEVRSFLLTGAGSLDSWKAQLQERFSLPVEIIDPEKPISVSAITGGLPVSIAAVGGVALASPASLLRLNPPEIANSVHQKQQSQDFVTVAVLGVLAVVLGVALMWTRVNRQEKLVAQLARSIEEIEPTAKRLKKQSRANRQILGLLRERAQLADLLDGVFLSLPDSMELEALTFEEARDEMTLRGRSSSTQEVLALLDRLKKLDRVRDVRLKHSTRRTTAAGERTDFELTIEQERL